MFWEWCQIFSENANILEYETKFENNLKSCDWPTWTGCRVTACFGASLRAPWGCCKRPAKHQLRRLLYMMCSPVVLSVLCVSDGGWMCVSVSVLEQPEKRRSFDCSIVHFQIYSILLINTYPRHSDTVVLPLYSISQGLPLRTLKVAAPAAPARGRERLITFFLFKQIIPPPPRRRRGGGRGLPGWQGAPGSGM